MLDILSAKQERRKSPAAPDEIPKLTTRRLFALVPILAAGGHRADYASAPEGTTTDDDDSAVLHLARANNLCVLF